MGEKQYPYQEGQSILSHFAFVFFDTRVHERKLHLRTSVNGDTRTLTLPMDDVGLRIVKHVHNNLDEYLIKSVERLHSKAEKQPKLKDIRKKAKFSSSRIGFIKRCLECIAKIREREGAIITQRAVAELLYGSPRSGGADRDARFSQDLTRKKTSFRKLVEIGKNWEELTSDEVIDLLQET